MRSIRAALAAAFFAAVAAACGGGSNAASTTTSCNVLPPGNFPHVLGTLGTNDRGTYCLHVGQVVQVALRGTLSERWTTVTASGSAVVGTQPIGVLTPRRDITLAFFRAARMGSSRLHSTFSGQTWSATIVVR